MINEEIANRVVNIEINVLKVTYQEILNNINKLHQRSKQYGGLGKLVKAEGSEVKLKDMVKKGQLEEIPVEEAELKELKKDMKVMDKAFKHALSESEKKTERKESIHKNIEKFKEMAKNSVSKDKVKNKQKEQSL